MIYDRAHSSFAEARESDWGALLAGAGWLHVSGVTAALNAHKAAAALNAVREARARGLRVSFDCNYRAKLWQAWDGDAPAILRGLAAEADLLFGGARDVALILGGARQDERAAADQAFAAFPNLKLMAATARVQHSVNHHALSAAMHARDASWQAPPLEITHIVDRIGAGDAFAAALIHKLRAGDEGDEAIRFALGGACIKHTMSGDFSLATAADIEAFLAAELDVRR